MEVTREKVLGWRRKYDYQPELTERLDRLRGSFDQAAVNEIVLWKLDRYASLDSEALEKLNRVVSLRQHKHRAAEETIRFLLSVRGVDLPMASALLRFKNPAVFQVIDQHAYRAAFGVRFRDMDRALYVFDRENNGPLSGQRKAVL